MLHAINVCSRSAHTHTHTRTQIKKKKNSKGPAHQLAHKQRCHTHVKYIKQLRNSTEIKNDTEWLQPGGAEPVCSITAPLEPPLHDTSSHNHSAVSQIWTKYNCDAQVFQRENHQSQFSSSLVPRDLTRITFAFLCLCLLARVVVFGFSLMDKSASFVQLQPASELVTLKNWFYDTLVILLIKTTYWVSNSLFFKIKIHISIIIFIYLLLYLGFVQFQVWKAACVCLRLSVSAPDSTRKRGLGGFGGDPALPLDPRNEISHPIITRMLHRSHANSWVIYLMCAGFFFFFPPNRFIIFLFLDGIIPSAGLFITEKHIR